MLGSIAARLQGVRPAAIMPLLPWLGAMANKGTLEI
jgi:hypothetical protein